MTRKEKEITRLYLDTALEVAKDEESWLSFLKSASYNYKYRFDEQILIYAQRPDATACAETTIWNRKLKRWVNKGSKGIALITDKNGETGLRFVFDVSDTNSNVYKRKLKLWTMEENYKDEVIKALENEFGELQNKSSIELSIISTAYNYISENMQDYLEELKDVLPNSNLDGLEEREIRKIFFETLMYSTISLVMLRCGMKNIPTKVFANINRFNTFETISILGTATRDFSREILLEISKTIISVQKREKSKNRTFEINKQTNYDKDTEQKKGSVIDENKLHNERGVSNARPSITREQEQESRTREVRQNEIELSKDKQEGNIHNIANEQQIYTVYNENFPLLQEEININDVMDKVAENPMNDYLKENRQQKQQTTEENISVDNTEQKEIFKLGCKEAYLFFLEMDLLKG